MSTTPPATPDRMTLVRCGIGGVFMGLANLVPGISGGTMLVAVGIYELFIDAVSDLSRLRFRARSVLIVAAVVAGAGLAIALLAGAISSLLVSHRWAMYALFIGLTLGGVPIVWKITRPMKTSSWAGLALGAGAMVALGLAQANSSSGSAGSTGWVMLSIAGVAGASAMILPGVSGAYLLLLLGQYRPILDAIHATKEAVQAGDLSAAMAQAGILVPVGVGVVVGIAGVANILRWLLDYHEKTTLGVLIGLLIGAPAGLYPFRHGVVPQAGEVFRGAVLTSEQAGELADKPKDWPEQAFTPTAGQIAGALGMVAVGIGITSGIALIGRPRAFEEDDAAASSTESG